MFPLKPFLFCLSEDTLPQVRRELLNLSADPHGEFCNVNDGLTSGEIDPDSHSFLVIEVRAEDFTDVRRLRQSYPDLPILALLAADSDSNAITHAIRQGVNQVSVLPFSGADFRDAVETIGLQYGHEKKDCQVISVAGSRGGVGTTTLSINLAYEIAQSLQLDTILIEMPPARGIVSTWLNLKTDHSIDDLLEQGKSLDEFSLKRWLVPYGERLSILPGCPTSRQDDDTIHLKTRKIVEYAKKMASVVVLDFQANLTESSHDLFANSSEQLLIGEQTIPSMYIMKDLIFGETMGCDPLVVINRFDESYSALNRERLADLLGVETIHTITNDHLSVLHAVNCGQPLRLSSPKSAVLSDIANLAQLVSGKNARSHAVNPNAEHEGFLHKIFCWS